jgi:hypothetical protein
LDDRAAQDYHTAVTASDEAFVWQVMTYYYPAWEEEERDGNASTDGSDLRGKKNGPKKGFRNTAGKTMHKYKEYICKMGRSRMGPNAALWSDNLRLAAQQIKREKEKVYKELEDLDMVETEPVDTGDLFEDFMQYTRFNFCEEDEQDGVNDVETVGV